MGVKKSSDSVHFWLAFLVGALLLAGAALVIPWDSPDGAMITGAVKDSGISQNMVVESGEESFSNQISTMTVFEGSSMSPTTIFILSAVLVVVLFIVILLYFEFLSPRARLKKTLDRTNSQMMNWPIGKSRKHYKDIFNFYLKIPEEKKKEYYPQIIQLRRKLEHQMKTEKELRELLEKTNQIKNIKTQKQNYLKIQSLSHALPHPTQGKYYPSILHLRGKMEKK